RCLNRSPIDASPFCLPGGDAKTHSVAGFQFPLTCLFVFLPTCPATRTIEFLNVLEVPLDAAVLLDQLLTHTPDFFQIWVGHRYFPRRMDCPKRTCGI